MDKSKQKSTKERSLYLLTGSRSGRNSRNIIYGSFIGVFIAITPILFYSYSFIPETKVWDTFLFTYNSGYYGDVRTSFWIIMQKLIPALLLFVWFFTCRHWWYHAILVPIAMFVYQIVGAVNDDAIFFDNFDLMYMIPIMCIIIPSIYLIRARMFDKINDADKTMQELEEEFMIKPTTFWGKIKQYF